MVISSTPIFATADILSTIEYYKTVLGFEATWTWGDPPSFGSASAGPATIMFNLQPELAAKVEGHQHWIKADDIDDLYALHVERGATIVSPIENKPWGAREYVVADPTGYHLRFAGSPVEEVTKSKPFPEGVRIERRKPTHDEHQTVVKKAFDLEHVPKDILDRTWQGIVALSPEGEAIGTVRIMYDAPGWYSVWDVAVLPEWQGHRIGEAMMKEALEAVRQVSPGAYVFLFTSKEGFYERLGFTIDTVTMRKV